jgi:hypothetical protein
MPRDQQGKPTFAHILRADPLCTKSDPPKSRREQSEKQREKQVALDWEGITAWPTDLKEREELRKTLDLDVWRQFRNGLPTHLRDSYEAPGERPPALDEQFDKFLVSQAQVIGARLLLSNLVLLRVLQWSLGTKNGISNLEKFANALVRCAKIRFDMEKVRGDITSEWHQAKIDTTDELAALQNDVVRNNVKRHRTPGLEEIKKTILRSDEMYPSLRANLTSFLEFCKQHAPNLHWLCGGSHQSSAFFRRVGRMGNEPRPRECPAKDFWPKVTIRETQIRSVLKIVST